MYLPIKPHKTCASAWLEAAKTVNAVPHHEAHNVIIGIAEPLTQTTSDSQIMTLVDEFLVEKGRLPLQSVANTIFPEPLYLRHGAPDLYDTYGQVYEKIKKKQGDWGRYFERMICRKLSSGKTINPLADLIAKMRQHVHGDGRTFRNIYELVVSDSTLDVSIYDPERDAGPVMNRQCLSFLSFKLDKDNNLLLTAMYRNHYYIERLLGNLIGLARLMSFVATEAGVKVGPLIVVSTHAQVDSPKGCRRGELSKLMDECEAACQTSEAA